MFFLQSFSLWLLINISSTSNSQIFWPLVFSIFFLLACVLNESSCFNRLAFLLLKAIIRPFFRSLDFRHNTSLSIFLGQYSTKFHYLVLVIPPPLLDQEFVPPIIVYPSMAEERYILLTLLHAVIELLSRQPWLR